MGRVVEEIVVNVEYSEGAAMRITDAFAELYYDIKKGIYTDPLCKDKVIKDGIKWVE